VTSLAEVYEAVRADKAFDDLRTPGIVLVPGEGSSRPNIMIVGEAPGATENTAKRPFVGASGKVLRSLITDCAGLKPEEYFITNIVKYRPPGNRTPTPREVHLSLVHLRAEWYALGRPKVLIAVGATALSAIRPECGGVMRAAGNSYAISGGRTLWPMVHPAYGLRNKDFQPTMEKHWEQFGICYREEYPG
jgi:DNA polymerase